MYNINQDYQKAINAPSRRIRGRVTIKNKVLSDGVSSIDYISSITGNEMSIGSTNASTVDIKFKTLIEGLQERELIKVSFTIETESGLVERQIGEFYLTEIKLDRNNKTTAVKAVDKMAFLNDQFKSTISYPALGKNIVQEIVNDCNLRVNNNLNISNLPSFDKKLEKISYREMLGYLAQTMGAFVVFNNRGELEFRKLTRTEKRISKSAYLLKGLEVDEVEFRINGISVDLKDKEKNILVMGSPLGTQVNLSNPLMTQGLLNSIYSEYKNLRFNPFKLNWRGDPFVEVGDWVSIEVSNGTYKAFPILSLKISYSGGLKSTISANVKGTASLTTEYKGTVQRQIEFINARLGSTGNLVYADTTEPKNPSEGDVWFKPNGAFTDLYIFEKGKWVLKTSTGDVEGVVTQITKSEILTKNFAAAIAKIIELDANRITTGSLSFERLSSKAVNSIREGLVTEEKLNDFVVNNEGLHQTLASEVKKEIEAKKNELKGKDGKVPAFNQLIGSYFPSLDSVLSINNTPLNLNLNDYNGHNSIEVDDKSSDGNLKGFAIPTSIRETVAGKHILMRIPIYVFPDSAHTSIKLAIFPLAYDAGFDLADIEKGKWVIKEFKFPFTKSEAWPFKTFVFGTFRGHFKIAEPYIAVDDTLTDKWLPAIEDMKANNLTASARIEGSYLNSELSNCVIYLDIFNNGNLIHDSTPDNELKIEIKRLVASGYKPSGVVTLGTNGRVMNIDIPNGKKDGKPIEVIFEVSYGGNRVVASARLENTVDIELVNTSLKKIKTFESTLETFKSKIGEVDTKKFKMAYNIENICSESGIEKKGNDLYFNAKTPLKANKEYYILADLDDVPSNQKTRIYSANNNGDSKEISNGLNIWRISFSSEQSRVNIYPLGSNTKVKNVEIYEVPEIETQDNANIYKSHKIVKDEANNVFVTITPTERLLLNKIYKVEIKTQGDFWEGSKWMMQYSLDASKEASKTFLKGTNTWIFRSFNNQDEIHFQIPNGVTVVDVKLFKLNYLLGYKSEFNISTVFSEIEQTKNQFRTAVTENNFGTVLTQNAKSLKLAWNNLSKYFQFEDESLVLYEGLNNSSKKRVKLDYTGINFYSKNGEFSGAVRGYYKPVSASWLNSDKYYAGMNFIIENNGRIGWFEETQEWGTTWEAPLLAYNYSDGKNDNKYSNQLVAFKDFIMENQLTVKGKLKVRGVVGDAGGSGNERAVFEGQDVNIEVAGLNLKFRNGILVDS